MKKLLTLSFLLFIGNILFAQQYKCGTDEAINQAFDNDPTYLKKRVDFLKFSDKYLKNTFIPNKGKSAGVHRIPIVFHVIHNYGPENISDAVIHNALDDMNDHWRKRDADTGTIVSVFQPIHDDMEIEFVLAKLDPQGNCTNGITRTVSELTTDGGSSGKGGSELIIKGMINWGNTKYLNVWIVKSCGQGVGGYSYFPGIGSARDGIMLRSDQVSAVSHEAGHWLALAHPWGGTNDPNVSVNCSDDDGISDTPNCEGSAGGCNTTRKTCLTDPEPFLGVFGQVLQATGQIIDPEQNYMDYAFCGAENFTQGQKAMCHASLDASTDGRNNLWTSANLIATGCNVGYSCNAIPISDFDSQDLEQFFCTGENVKFENNSHNADNITYAWAFENGTPATSILKEPTVKWNTPGKYKVSLVATSAGGSDTKIKESYIIIFADNPAIDAPLIESFDQSTFPVSSLGADFSWIIKEDATTNDTWERTTSASISGSASMMIDCRSAKGVNEFISPAFDFTTGNCSELTFNYAYAQRTVSTNDQLRVLVSRDCGYLWKSTTFDKKGSALSTAAGKVLSTAFVPTSSEWAKGSVDLSAYTSRDHLLIKFEHTALSKGNILYIDNVNIGCGTVGIDNEDDNTIEFKIYPNPSTDDASLYVNSINSAKMKVNITDLTGKVIFSKEYYTNNKKLKLSLNEELGFSLNAGVYLVNISDGKTIKTQKIVKN